MQSKFSRHLIRRFTPLAITWLLIGSVDAGVFEFAGDKNGTQIIAHPTGYSGKGGKLTVTVGILPTSPFINEMTAPLQNAIKTWNELIPTIGNIIVPANDIPDNHYDFESVILHELGHCLGLSHPNLASESGLAGDDKNYTASTKGANNQFDLNSGSDGIIGSRDDLRGDDVNLHWFYKDSNNPFTLPAIIDKTTYSQNVSDLPTNDQYVANGDRNVSLLSGLPETEAVMQQGIQEREARRTLTADDVATLRLAMSGLDMLQDTGDDYQVQLQYIGATDNADIVVAFDNQASFSACNISGQYIAASTSHVEIVSGHISLNTGFLWHFNQQPTPITMQLPALAVYANQQQKSITLTQGEHLTLTISLDPTTSGGNLADYWVKAETPAGNLWLNDQLQFEASDNPLRAYGGPLVNIDSFTLFDASTANLPPGTYTIRFAVDSNINALYDGTYEQRITFTINP